MLAANDRDQIVDNVLARVFECWHFAHRMTQENSSPEPMTRPALTAEERLLYSVLPCRYAWPASRLNGHDMHRLSQIRDATRKPITRLLQDAIELLYLATAAERAATAQRQAEARERFRMSVPSLTPPVAEQPTANIRATERQKLLQFEDCQLAAEQP